MVISRDSSNSPNQRTYEHRNIVAQYAQSRELYPAEAHIFRSFARQFSGRVLDIAIGAGRTTGALLSGCATYVGIDYSEAMIVAARRAWPGADLRVMDMREVPNVLSSQQFDAILISFNSLDYISWEDRCTLLDKLVVLLADEGVLAFSSHSLADVERQRGFRLLEHLRASLKGAYRPRTLARFLLRTPPWILKAWRNRRRNRHLEAAYDGYAYVNDSGEDYGLITTYVETSKQLEQLRTVGLSRVEVVQPWLLVDPAYFYYYVCQR